MKRFSYYFSLLFMMALPLMLTSCDDDDWYDRYDWYDNPYYDGSDYALDLASTLNGTWSGAIVNEYTNDYGQREQSQCSAEFTFVQYRYDAINGTGYETDYVTGETPKVNRFKWYVDERTGNVYVEYLSSGYRYLLDCKGNSSTSGFSLDNNNFNGVMEGINNDEYIFFDFTRSRAYVAPNKTAAKKTNVLRFGASECKPQFDGNMIVKSRER